MERGLGLLQGPFCSLGSGASTSPFDVQVSRNSFSGRKKAVPHVNLAVVLFGETWECEWFRTFSVGALVLMLLLS